MYSYTAAEVRRVLSSLRPAAICVELFPGDITADGFVKPEVIKEAYAPEIGAVNEAAQALGIRQVAIEREDRNENWAKTDYLMRMQRMNQQLSRWLKALPDQACLEVKLGALNNHIGNSQAAFSQHGSAESINSEAHDELIRAKRASEEALLMRFVAAAPYPEAAEDVTVILTDARERNDIMAQNILRVAQRYAGKQIVVTTGAEHRCELRDRLVTKPGIILKEFWQVGPRG